MRTFKKISIVSFFSIFLLYSSAEAAIVNFDTLPGMLNSPGSTVPAESQLSDAFLSTIGVFFSSAAGFVAVVDHSPYPTVSPPNVISGVTSDGLQSFGTPIEISFFDPNHPETKGVTDSVTIRGDQAR